MKTTDFEISDEQAEKMPIMFQTIRRAFLEWKKTGYLPNGQTWQPVENGEKGCDL